MATTTKTEWRPMVYGSGSHTVTPFPYGDGVDLRVDLINGGCNDEAQRHRWAVCVDLAAYLNGGPRPAWMADLDYTGGDEMTGADGLVIAASGPYYDANPPYCQWQLRNDEAAKSARAWLMFQLHR